MKKSTATSWCIYILFSVFIIAILLTFAEPAWAIQQKMTQGEADKKIKDAYAQQDDSNGMSEITGMASGGSTAGIVAILIGVIMGIVTSILSVQAFTSAKAGAVCAIPDITQSIRALCIGLLVVSAILIIAGIMLMSKAKEVKSNKRNDAQDYATIQAGLQQQATMNQKPPIYPSSATA